MFLWDERRAKRGALEIASCIDMFCKKHVPDSVKNSTIVLFYLHLVHSGRFKEISHIYFQLGHTYMAADHNFGMIESAKRVAPYIYTPMDYVELLRKCRKHKEWLQGLGHPADACNEEEDAWD